MTSAGSVSPGRGTFTGDVADVRDMRSADSYIRTSLSTVRSVAEYAYNHPSHKVSVTLGGGTRSTEAWLDGRHTYAGADRPGAVSVIPGGRDRRAVLRDGRFRVVTMALDPVVVMRLVAQEGAGPQRLEIPAADNIRDTRLEALAKVLDDRLRAGTPWSRLLGDTLNIHLAHCLIRRAGLRLHRSGGHGLHPRALARVVDLVEARLVEDLDLTTLATEAGLGPFAFIRAFRASTGTTPHRFVNTARVARAKALLVDLHTPIASIAVKVGFSSHSHLSAVFSGIAGVTPSAYRDRSRKGQLPDSNKPA